MTVSSVHPLKNRARILLSSVFGPYARDDEFGSRALNPMELYQNQVTRTQGVFSLRMFHRSFGLLLLQANVGAPCVLLDFPTQERFIQEIREHEYDIVGISAIGPNIGKLKKMCSLVRTYRPQATIVVGGHIANREDLSQQVDADHIVRGDGVRWLRGFLGEDQKAPIRHPMVYSGFGTRCLGIPVPEPPGSTAAMLIPSVGCPLGCNFCSTSAMFGGKGKSVNFYETGDELFAVMCRIEARLEVQSFFVMDENFLLQRQRALRLLELMQKHRKSWSLYLFSSARVLKSYTMEQLVELGVSWVWMGLEGRESAYAKLRSINTRRLVKMLQDHGIRVLGSSIIGLEHHTPENMKEIIDYAVSHQTDFHQFMLYTPVPGTPLHAQHQKQGTLIPESQFPAADAHGQYRFNYRHPHIQDGQEEHFLVSAFERDFEKNGPSLARLIGTTLKGWQRYRKHPDPRVRKRFAADARPFRTIYAGSIWAMNKWFRKNPAMAAKMKDLLAGIYREFGIPARIFGPLVGGCVYIMLKLEEKRLRRGWTYEPVSFYEKNRAAIALERSVSATLKKGWRSRWHLFRRLPVVGTISAMVFDPRK